MPMIPQYNTELFCNIWENETLFLDDVTKNPLNIMNEEDIIRIYYLLYAKYGNTPIASSDVHQFKFQIFSTIFEFGPTWSKKLEIQKKLRNLSEEELMTGSKAIYNRALNPETAPSTSSNEELTYISDQNTTKYRKPKMIAYAELLENLESGSFTEQFVKRFAFAFKTFVNPDITKIYYSED